MHMQVAVRYSKRQTYAQQLEKGATAGWQRWGLPLPGGVWGTPGAGAGGRPG